MEGDYVTKADLAGEYVSRDQLWSDMRELATDLRAEIAAADDVHVTVEASPIVGASMAVLAVACLTAVIDSMLRRRGDR